MTDPARQHHQRALSKFPMTIENLFQPDNEVSGLQLSQRLKCWTSPMTDRGMALQDYAAYCLQMVVGTKVVTVLLQVQ